MGSRQVMHPTVRFAHRANIILTWGIPAPNRSEMLAELLADWEAMYLDRGARAVVFRALRGAPVQLWDRLVGRDVTAIPVAVAAGTVGLGGILASSPAMQYPLDHRMAIALSAFGILLLSVTMLREPRRLTPSRYRWPCSIAVAGLVGMALTMPTPDDWNYQAPFVSTPELDLLMQFSMVLTAFGMALVAVVGASSRRHFLLAGGLIIAGVALFGVTELAWACWVVPIDLAAAGVAMLVGSFLLSTAHVALRLRHLEFVERGRG